MKVNLTYFKQSGKYYSSGEYVSKCKDFWEVYTEVNTLREMGKLPGLRDNGGSEFTIHIGFEDDAPPHVIVPHDGRLEDYQRSQEDHKRLVRELDVILNGQDGAARQASFIDVIGQLKREQTDLIEDAEDICRRDREFRTFIDCLEALILKWGVPYHRIKMAVGLAYYRVNAERFKNEKKSPKCRHVGGEDGTCDRCGARI